VYLLEGGVRWVQGLAASPRSIRHCSQFDQPYAPHGRSMAGPLVGSFRVDACVSTRGVGTSACLCVCTCTNSVSLWCRHTEVPRAPVAGQRLISD
jgi:hypothetical protein